MSGHKSILDISLKLKIFNIVLIEKENRKSVFSFGLASDEHHSMKITFQI